MSVALDIQHAKRLLRIILSSVACPHFSVFLHIVLYKARFEGKKVKNHKFFCFDLREYDEKYLLIPIKSTRISRLILIQFFFLTTDFSKILKYQISFFKKNPSSGSRVCSTRTDGRSGRYQEANSLFRNFANGLPPPLAPPKKNSDYFYTQIVIDVCLQRGTNWILICNPFYCVLDRVYADLCICRPEANLARS